MFVYLLEMVCVAAFSISGVMVESNRGRDIISILMLGWVTALGGGTVRDIIMNAETVFWIRDPNYFWTALVSSFAAFFFITQVRKSQVEKLVVFFDTVGVSLFSVVVTGKLTAAGYAPYVAVSMGLVTAVFGGVLRDVLAHRPTIFNNTELYATPVILGCSLYVLLLKIGAHSLLASIFCMAFIVFLRLYTLIRKINFPSFLVLK
jgi:uncharacterized membrane protein YeiH